MTQMAARDQDVEFRTDLPIGEILRRTRVHYGQNISDIARILRIRASQLEAIEAGAIEQLPGRVYAIGFVRSYSEYLGLDGDQMVRLFKEQSVGGRSKPALNFPVPASESQLPSALVVVGSVFGVVLLMAAWTLMYNPSKKMVREIPPVPAELKAETLQEKPVNITEIVEAEKAPDAATLNAIEPASIPDAPAHKVMLRVKENSWVEIRNQDGAAILRQVLRKGDEYTIPSESGLVLSTGNAGGIDILVDGKVVPPIGRSAQVRRDVSLNPEDLLKSVE